MQRLALLPQRKMVLGSKTFARSHHARVGVAAPTLVSTDMQRYATNNAKSEHLAVFKKCKKARVGKGFSSKENVGGNYKSNYNVGYANGQATAIPRFKSKMHFASFSCKVHFRGSVKVKVNFKYQASYNMQPKLSLA